MPQVSLGDWNKFLQKHPNAHLLQLGEWGELKSAFGWKPIRVIFDDETGAQILFRSLPFGLTIGYMPKPVFSKHWSAVSDQFWMKVDLICRKHRAVFLKVEPDLWDEETSIPGDQWLVSSHNIQPPRTIILDIESREDEILAGMKQKCRYNIRLAEKKDVVVRSWEDIPAFYGMILITGGRDRFGVHSFEYYKRAYELFHPRGKCVLLVAEFEERPLAALMVFANGKRTWYVYGASNDLERNRMPTYLLQWEAVRWAKARGCEEYDLWGVPDEDEDALETGFETRQDGLWGVYRFKRGFGGRVRRAAQAVDRVYNPLMYKLYLWRMAGREAG